MVEVGLREKENAVDWVEVYFVGVIVVMVELGGLREIVYSLVSNLRNLAS